MQTTSLETTNLLLPQAEVSLFHERGFLGPFTVYQPEEMQAIWKRVRIGLHDRSRSAYADSPPSNITNYDRHLDMPSLAAHICRPEIVDRVASVMGPDLLCWRSEFFPKHAGDEGTDWHQVDTFVTEAGGPQLVWPSNSDFGGTLTAWTAFTDTDTDTACLQFIPGTHRTMFYDESRNLHYDPHRVNQVEKDGVRSGFFGYDFRERQKDPNWSPDLSRAVAFPMRAGQCILFWSTLMHGSHPHRGKTSTMRMGFSARYVPTSVRVYPGTDSITEFGGTVSLARHGVVVVSGRDDFKHNRVATRMLTGEPFLTR